jgi:hypothetical protein
MTALRLSVLIAPPVIVVDRVTIPFSAGACSAGMLFAPGWSTCFVGSGSDAQAALQIVTSPHNARCLIMLVTPPTWIDACRQPVQKSI